MNHSKTRLIIPGESGLMQKLKAKRPILGRFAFIEIYKN